MSTIDQAHIRESPPAKDRRPNHWATTPAIRQRSPKKTALGWHSYAFRQSLAHQLWRQSLQCSWTSNLELSVDGPQTAGFFICTTVSDSRWRHLVSGTKTQC